MPAADRQLIQLLRQGTFRSRPSFRRKAAQWAPSLREENKRNKRVRPAPKSGTRWILPGAPAGRLQGRMNAFVTLRIRYRKRHGLHLKKDPWMAYKTDSCQEPTTSARAPDDGHCNPLHCLPRATIEQCHACLCILTDNKLACSTKVPSLRGSLAQSPIGSLLGVPVRWSSTLQPLPLLSFAL